MNKNYMKSIAFTLCAMTLGMQYSQAQNIGTLRSAYSETVQQGVKQEINAEKDAQNVIWSNTFSSEDDWTIEHGATCELDWQVGSGLENEGAYPTPNIQSTTASDGFAMLDSDFYGATSGGVLEDSYMTNTIAIDLTDYEGVKLVFESHYRAFNDDACWVAVSANGTDWPAITLESEDGDFDNAWRIHEDIAVNTSTVNPTTVEINVSSVIGGASTAYIRFHWVGIWGYSWFVDDVTLVEVPANDMRMDYGVISHNSSFDEYGRVPVAQLNDNINFGAVASNQGAIEQTDVVIDLSVESSDGTEVLSASSDIVETLAVQEEITMDEDLAIMEFATDLYTAYFTVTSNEEDPDSATFDNNTVVRNFAVTEDLYSLDGIGVHETANVSALGTGSFIDNTDGFMVFVYYDLNQEENAVYGIEIELSGATEEGGTVLAHLFDTTDVYNDNIDQPLTTVEYEVTQMDVDNGFMRMYFDDAEILDANAYFAGVEMYSNDGENEIYVLDDITVPQPAGSSMIYIPNGQTGVYTNGNAAAVRLLMSGPNSVNEIEDQIADLSIAPNPSRDNARIIFDLSVSTDVKIEVTDLLGKVVLSENLNSLNAGQHQYQINVSDLKAGSYHYSVITNAGRVSRSMQIVK